MAPIQQSTDLVYIFINILNKYLYHEVHISYSFFTLTTGADEVIPAAAAAAEFFLAVITELVYQYKSISTTP